MPSPQRVSWAKFRVTVVAAVAILILVTLLYLLTGSTLLSQQAELYVYVPDATGLGPGSPVEVNGLPVGEVTDVQLTGSTDPNRIIKLTLEVVKDRLKTISDDSIAQIDTESLVGDKLIQITSRTSPAAIRPGAVLQFKPQADLMRSIDLSQFQAQLRAIDATLTDIESGKSAFGQFVLGDQMYTDLLHRIAEIERAMHSAVDTAHDVGGALYTDRIYRQVRDPIVQLDESLARIQSGQGAAGRFLRDPAQFDSFRNEISGLRKSIADLRGGAFVQSDEAYNGWLEMVGSWIRNVDQMNASPLFATSEVYDNLAGAAKEMQNGFREFRQDPRKFLRLKVF